MVELLLANKADVNANAGGYTPLVFAAWGGHQDVVDFLRQHGGRDANSTDASDQKSRTFFAGEISMKADLSATETKLFTCTPVQPFKKGDKVAAIVSDDQAWSVDKLPLQVGTNQVPYPVMASVKSSDGFHSIFPAVLKAKTDIKAGETLRSDGYQIETKRAVKASETISVLVIGGSAIFSVEAAEGAKDRGVAKPWFTAYKDGTKLSDSAPLLEAWRLENDHVGR